MNLITLKNKMIYLKMKKAQSDTIQKVLDEYIQKIDALVKLKEDEILII